ncbi:MAG: DUF2612 domain-containing protein [Cytophagaceae bacterium]|nr:MAG: DUF2612 domain-containing protein [Cytophagaceae bacterium]
MDAIETHVADSLSRLLHQNRSLPRITALVTTLAEQVQVIENAINQVYLAQPLKTAVGDQLDKQGAIIGLARNGLDDATYRVLLFGQIALNNSDATVNSLVSLIKLVWQCDTLFIQTPNTLGHNRRMTPAQLSVQVCDPRTSLTLKSTLLRILQSALPAGVALTQVDVTTAQNGGTFAFAGSQPWVKGFGSGTFCTPLYANSLD